MSNERTPAIDERLSELLSGYVDDVLSPQEQAEVERHLSENDAAREYVSAIRLQGEQLAELFAATTNRSLKAGFPDRVIAAAQALDEGLSPIHHVRLADSAAASTSTRNPSWGAIGGLLVTAAALVLAVSLPGLLNPPTEIDSGSTAGSLLANNTEPVRQADAPNADGLDSTKAGEANPAPELSAAEPASRYVSDQDYSILYTLVVDVEASKVALENDVLGALFEASGVKTEAPIVGTEQLDASLSEARMKVSDESESVKDSLVYFIHADLRSVGEALTAIYSDSENFPSVRFDLAFDTPANRLMKKIAESTGQRFAVNQSFAAPIQVAASESETLRASPFAGIAPQGKLVSASSRRSGAAEVSQLGMLGDSKTCVLLLVRLPEL